MFKADIQKNILTHNHWMPLWMWQITTIPSLPTGHLPPHTPVIVSVSVGEKHLVTTSLETQPVLYHRFTQRCGLRFGNASCVTDVWSPYRITPIHWLMVRRRLWRNHVVSLYWWTQPSIPQISLPSHCPSLLRFSGPIIYSTRLSICTSATASVELCSPCGEVP